MAFQDYAEEAQRRLDLGKVSPQALIGLAVICAACVAALWFGLQGVTGDGGFQVTRAQEADELAVESAPAEAAPTTIRVHVTGCVPSPGVYELAEDARVADAVALAGGLTEEASEESLNLAATLSDGEQVRVPGADEAAAAAAASPSGSAAAAPDAPAKVNINTADAAQLQTISGIGASKAQKIVSYREANGAFKSIEDIVNVSGIGEKTLASIRDQICV